MKRIRLLLTCASLTIVLLLHTNNLYATKVFAINDDFTTTPAANWGFTTVSGHSFTYDPTNKRELIRWGNPSSYTTKVLSSAVTPGSDNKVTIETIVQYYTSGSSSSVGNLYFLDTNGNAIFGVCFGRFSSSWRIGRATTYPGAIVPTAYPSTTDILASNSPIAKITAVLNFSEHTFDYTAQVGTFDNSTRVFTATSPSVSSVGQTFINSSASDLKTMLSNFFRGSTTSGTNGYDLMYMGVYTEQTVSTASVTVKFKDQDGAYFKSDEIVADQVVDATYNASIAQKASVNTGGNYYVLDPASTLSTTVNSGGSTLELLFRKSTNFASLTWNGTTDTNGNLWSEWYQNCINGITSVGYQKNSSLTFDATALNPAVVVNEGLDLGTGNYSINTTGYTLSGTGTIGGSGALNVNLSGSEALSIGVTNNMTGRTQIAGGHITVTKSGALGSNVDVNGITTFIANANLPTLNFNDDGYIQPTAGTSISGMSITSGNFVQITSATNNVNGTTSFSFTPTGTVSGNLELNGTNTDVRWGMLNATTNYLLNSRVSLTGTSSMLFIDTNQGAATTINIGSLIGDAGSKLGWGRSSALERTITWSVGSLNESTEYAGTITNLGGYNTGGAFYTGTNTNFAKVGSGILTFSGTANTHNGSFDVSGGELRVSGATAAIGKVTTTMTISNNCILSAKNGGVITAGTLNIGAAATLDVDATSVANLSLVRISTTGSTAGHMTLPNATTIPTLEITATSAPAKGTTIQIVNAADPSTIIYTNTPSIPAGYSYNQATGVLTYYGKDITSATNSSSIALGYTNGTINLSNNAELTVDANETYNTITVGPGAKITIAATKALTSNITLESNENITATLIDNGTITGTVTVKQYLTGSNSAGTPNGRFWYVTSPVSNATSAVFAPSTGNKFWSHSEVTNAYTPITADNVDLTAGKGYVARMKDNTTITYTGTPITGDKTIEITRTGTENLYRGFNLIGNPYPSFARIKAEDNASIESSLWFRTKVGTSNSMAFDTYNILTGDSVSGSGNPISGYIPPMQAFWVKTMTPGASNVTFKQAYRFHGDPITADIKLRGASVDTTACVRIRLSNGKTKDETLIKFYPNATDAFDRHDSHKMKNNVDSFPEIFTMCGNEELAINGMKHDGRTKAFALGFRTGKKGDFKLKVIEMKNLGDSVRVVLKDKVKNCEKELMDSSEYDFTSDVTTTTDRFSIVISANAPTALNNVSTSTADAFSTGDNQIQVRLIGTTSNVAKVTVFNTMGQNIGIFTTDAANTVLDRRFAPGVYMVNVVTDGVQTTKKVVVNQ